MKPMFDPDALPVPDLGFACPDCGYPLAGLTEHRCPECGRPFELEQFIPAGEFPPLIAGGRFVTATDDVLMLMRTYQIPVVELRSAVRTVFGGLMPGGHEGVRIAVPRSRYLEAIDLIRRMEQYEPLPPPPDAAAGADSPWVCDFCGEENPPTFGLCWNCEGERGEPAGGL